METEDGNQGLKGTAGEEWRGVRTRNRYKMPCLSSRLSDLKDGKANERKLRDSEKGRLQELQFEVQRILADSRLLLHSIRRHDSLMRPSGSARSTSDSIELR